MTKSADAFRTISEVAEWLGRPTHVLRFWESKFTQVKPIKRAGGRRYYRPEDMLLLGGIKRLLHDDGMTIKGVQKVLREQGVKHVAELSQALDVMAEPDALVPSPEQLAALKSQQAAESATLLQFPRPDDAAEAELSDTSFEQAAKDLVPDPVPPSPPVAEPDPQPAVEPVAEPAPDVEAEASEPFEAPTFFNMFNDLDPGTSDQDAAEPDDAKVTPEPDQAAEVAAPTNVPGPSAKLTPKIVDVAVDARSDKGAGVLSRLMSAPPDLRANPPAELAAVRENLDALRNRLRTG